MAKKLRVRDKILLGLAILGDAYFEIAEPLWVQRGKMKGFLPSDYKASNFTTTVSKMLKTGYMEKVIKDGEPYLRLTGRGKEALTRDFPLFALKKKWDGYWRMVFYDIPEEERDVRVRFQRHLKSLGFGAVQESVYLSPFDVAEDVREFIESENLADFVFASVAKKLFAGNEKVLAEKVWQLAEINEEYIALEEKIKKGDSRDEILSQYEEVLRRDPCLPKELLSPDWRGEKVYREVRQLLVSKG